MRRCDPPLHVRAAADIYQEVADTLARKGDFAGTANSRDFFLKAFLVRWAAAAHSGEAQGLEGVWERLSEAPQLQNTWQLRFAQKLWAAFVSGFSQFLVRPAAMGSGRRRAKYRVLWTIRLLLLISCGFPSGSKCCRCCWRRCVISEAVGHFFVIIRFQSVYVRDLVGPLPFFFR